MDPDPIDNLPSRSERAQMSTSSEGDGEDARRNSWREQFKPLKKKYYEMQTGQENCEPFPTDVTFQVGSNRTNFTAHRLILSISCKFFEEYFCKNKFISPETLILFPALDPFGFKKTLEHMYSDEIDTDTKSDANKLVAVLKVAKHFHYNELEAKCFKELRLLITSETALKIYDIAVANTEERLEDLARAHISNHIKQVFSSTCFDSLSEQQVCTLLKLNDWHLPETEVFENVKRWCLRNVNDNVKKFLRADGTVRGRRLRTAMGETFHNIRFLLMEKDDWETIVVDHKVLFTGDEYPAFLQYFRSSKETREGALKQKSLQQFVSAQGLIKRGSPRCATFPAENSNGTSTEQMGDNCSVTQSAACTMAAASNVDLEPHPSPTKRVRLDEQVLSSPESIPMQTLDNFITQLANDNERHTINVIDETLEYQTASLPSKRVLLPNLSKFRIRLESKKKFSCGTEFKAQVRVISANLYGFLFFDKNNEIGPRPSYRNNIDKLLNQKVDISLHFRGCLIFSISHSEGSLSMNLFEETESILQYLKTFPLKKLAISESAVSSLEPIRRDLLQVIVLRKIAGMVMAPLKFIQCESLKKFTCDDVDTDETIYFVKHILCKNPYLEELCLANCNLAVGKDFGKYRVLRRLYLNNCKINNDNLHRILSLFPSLKRLQLNGIRVDSEFIYKILESRSVEWVLVSGMTETQEVVAVKQFLYRVLSSPSLSKTGLGQPFVIEQVLDGSEGGKPRGYKMGPSINYNRTNTRWRGTSLTAHDLNSMSILEFEHSSLNEFYSSYGAFNLAEFSQPKGDAD